MQIPANMSQGNILIIGGSGFVSGTIARTARDQGHKVWVLTRGQKPLPEGVIPIRVNRKDASAFKAAVAGVNVRWDIVVDCIAYEPEDARQDMDIFPALARHLVLISTDFAFDPGQRRFPQPFDNPATVADDSYGGKKRRCEQELLKADPGDMRWTIIRPCHIYGPGSELGCLPDAMRVPGLLRKLKAGEPLRLVGGGHFLQQPIFAPDLAAMILSANGNPMADRKIYCSAGPDIVESVEYYRIIAASLGVDLHVEELSMTESLTAHPDWKFFLCHRIYDLAPIRLDGLKVPNTPLHEGLRQHVKWLAAHND